VGRHVVPLWRARRVRRILMSMSAWKVVLAAAIGFLLGAAAQAEAEPVKQILDVVWRSDAVPISATYTQKSAYYEGTKIAVYQRWASMESYETSLNGVRCSVMVPHKQPVVLMAMSPRAQIHVTRTKNRVGGAQIEAIYDNAPAESSIIAQ
jgi:hypothetical protein